MKQITRLKELLSILKDYDEDSFVYTQQTKAGTVLTIEEPIKPGQTEYTSTTLYITPVPLSTQPAQEYLKAVESMNAIDNEEKQWIKRNDIQWK